MSLFLFIAGVICFLIGLVCMFSCGSKKLRESAGGVFIKSFPGFFLLSAFCVMYSVILYRHSPLEATLFDLAVLVLGISFLGGLFATIRPYKRRRLLSFTTIIPFGLFFAGWLMYFAAYYCGTSGEGDLTSGNLLRSVFMSAFHALKLFALDGGYASIVARTSGFGDYHLAYEIFFALLYSFGAVATLTAFVTIVKNLSAKLKYYLKRVTFWKKVHVFSCLTEESLAIACSLVTTRGMNPIKAFLFQFKKPVIVFTDISRRGTDGELIERAKEIGSILFHKDIGTIKFCGLNHVYYVMGDDEGEKLRQANELSRHYDNSRNRLYVFSESVQSEMFLNGLDLKNMKLVRINAIQSLVYRSLYDNGVRLFQNAAVTKDSNGDKVISAVIVGLGMYGKEMLKALTWYCQMDGYRLKINAYDSDADAEKKLRLSCPDMMAMSDKQIEGDSYYSINIHKFDIEDPTFYDHLATITDVSYVFVCLGDDERNAKMAKSIRELYSGLKNAKGYFKDRLPGTPDIETVIYDTSIKEKLGMTWSDKTIGASDKEVDGGKNFKKQPYRIHVIGDLKSFYSARTLTSDDSDELIQAAMGVHLRWAETCVVNSLYDNSIIKHIKEKSKEEGKKVVCIIKPYLTFNAPVVSHLSLEDIFDGNLVALGISKERLDEIWQGLYKRLNKEWKVGEEHGFTSEERESLCGKYYGTYCFIVDNLTYNYDYMDVDEVAENKAKELEGETDKKKRKKIKREEEVLAVDTLLEVGINEHPEIGVRDNGDAKRFCIADVFNVVKSSFANIIKWFKTPKEDRAEMKRVRDAEKTALKRYREIKKIAEEKIENSKENDKKKFWRYSYYYRSSICKAMHESLRLELVEKNLISDERLKTVILLHAEEKCTRNDLMIICNLEHIRWNAFMRSEGYSYAKKRLDLAKQHDNLVPTEKLTIATLRKDI